LPSSRRRSANPEHTLGRQKAGTRADPTLTLPFTRSLAMHMLGAVVAILAIVAAPDYLFQYRPWFERHKMSLRELKEGFRQTEGDPTVKERLPSCGRRACGSA
jgi:flagellar biosynthetic protein FlhB